jgi:hypothetical protein
MSGSGPPYLSHTAAHNSLRAHGGNSSLHWLHFSRRNLVVDSKRAWQIIGVLFGIPVEIARPVFGRTFDHHHTHSHLSNRTLCAALVVSRGNKMPSQW